MADVTGTMTEERQLLTAPSARDYDADITGTLPIFPVMRSFWRYSASSSAMVANDTWTVQATVTGDYVVEVNTIHVRTSVASLVYDGALVFGYLEILENVGGNRGSLRMAPLQNNQRFSNTLQILQYVPEQAFTAYRTDQGAFSIDAVLQFEADPTGLLFTTNVFMDLVHYPVEAERSSSFWMPRRNARQGL